MNPLYPGGPTVAAPVSVPTERYAWIDRARGVGIILVVMGHVMRGLTQAGVPHDAGLISAVDFTLYTFHMPLFFLLSGLWSERALRQGARPFLTRRLLTVVYPYFLWSLVQGGIILAMGERVNAPIAPMDLVMIPVRPIGQFWFLWVLMACHIVAACLGARRRELLLLSVPLFVASSWLPGVTQAFGHQLIFYAIGAVIGPWLLSVRLNMRVIATMGVIALLLFAPAALLAREVLLDPESAWAIGAALTGITATVCLAMALRFGDVIAVLGSASMTIYVLHILAAAGTRVAMAMAGIELGFGYQVVIGTVVGVAMPTLAHLAGKRLGVLPALGLAAPCVRPTQTAGAANG